MQKFAKFATWGATAMAVFSSLMIMWTYFVEATSPQQAGGTIAAFVLTIALYCVARLAFQAVRLEEFAEDEEDDEMEELAAGL